MDTVIIDETITEIIELLTLLEKTTTPPRIVLSNEDNNLKQALESIKPVDKILHVEDHNEAKVLLRNLKNAINDLSDLLEEISTERALPHQSRQSTLSFFKIGPPKDSQKTVNTKVKNVIETLKNVKDKLSTLHTTQPRPTQEEVEKKEETKVGNAGIRREKEKKEVIDQLMSLRTETLESDVVPIPVVTIVGGAGIGKTKLARLVCEDAQVKDHFGAPIPVDDMASLNKTVANTRLAKREGCLVVMKNLKTEISDDNLNELRKLFASSGGKSAILITTRSKLVAMNITGKIRSNNKIAAGFISFRPHILQGLDELESRSLFQSIRGDDNKEKESEEKYLKDCGGVPSLIIFAAIFLKSHSGGSTAAAASSATVTAFKDADALKLEFLKKLKLRYYDKKLSRLHKMCFTFCSLFPRDHLIDVERLIHLWRADGFLMDVKTTTAEETLRQCFNDLVERSIFRDIEEDECGVVKRCRMIPLMHDLARFVSDQEENVMVDPEGEKVNKEILRASFDFSLDVSRGIPSSLFEKAEKLRAILLWKTQTLLPKEGETSTSTCDQIFKAFKSTLRVLDLHDMGIKTFPNSVGDMNNLRYLDLSFNTMEKLPSSITKLSNLQTLKLSKCYHLKELPKNIDELTNLNHLEIDGCLALTQMPSKINKLGGSLQTLSLFVVSKDHSGGLKDLAHLNNLRGHLEISHLEISGLVLSKKDNYLKNKEHLQSLTLRWDHEDDQEEKGDTSTSNTDFNLLECLEPHSKLRTIFLVGYKGEKFSTWFSSKKLECLVKLRLYDCTSCNFLPQLDQFPKLRFLELLRLDNLKYISENGSDKDKQAKDYFPSLKELTISDCPNLKSWWNEDEKETDKSKKDLPFFANLSKLHVHYCPNLICMPLFPDLDEELVLVGSSVKPLLESIAHGEKEIAPEEPVLVGSSVKPLLESIAHGEKEIALGKKECDPFSKLKSMKIANIEDSQSPSEKSIKYFNSLEKLDIKGWKHLKSLPEGFDNLSSLQSLNIENCQELDLSSTKWEGLEKLHSLTIREVPKLETLPLGVYKATSLQDLQLHNCPNLTSLPETIDKLESLRKLVISECDKLASLPKALKNVKSLHTLIILDCTLLLPRCQPDTGDDWPQIAHIKNKQVTETYRNM